MDGDMMESDVPALPLYKCHKLVHALKIAEIKMGSDLNKNAGANDELMADNAAILIPADKGYASVYVDAAYVAKHAPKAGGYYVVYHDGYKSFSPAKAFEDGYSLA